MKEKVKQLIIDRTLKKAENDPGSRTVKYRHFYRKMKAKN